MNAKVLHEGITFADQLVPLSGHAYRRCTFRRCTMVVSGAGVVPSEVSHCHFETCNWVLNLTITDAESWRQFLTSIGALMRNSLPDSIGHRLN